MRALLRALPLASAFACSTLVGADFDDLEVAPAQGGAGGSAQGGSGNDAGKGNRGGGGNTGGDTSSGGTAGQTGGGAPSEGGAGASEPAGGAPQGGQGGGGAANVGGAGGEPGVGGTPGEHPVVLNEVKGQGNDVVDEDYIELYNTGAEPEDVSDFRVSDGSNAFAFPPGTVIPAGGYIIIMLDDTLTTGGPHTCFDLEDGCFYIAEWGISAGGEFVFFRDPQNQTLDFTEYPDELDLIVMNGESWGRLPNGSGAFAASAITPGEANTPP